MAEPGRRDEQSRNYEASISSDTERGDAEHSRSTGEGDRRRRFSDGNFMQINCHSHNNINLLYMHV